MRSRTQKEKYPLWLMQQQQSSGNIYASNEEISTLIDKQDST